MKTESRIVSTILPLPNIQVDEQDNYYFTDTDINASHRYQNHKNPILRFIDQITIPLSAFSLFSSVSPLQ